MNDAYLGVFPTGSLFNHPDITGILTTDLGICYEISQYMHFQHISLPHHTFPP